jgi:hypothetical protein
VQLRNDIMMNPDEPSNPNRMRTINEAVYFFAGQQAGVTAADLADENQENSPRVLHYWTLTSQIMAKVYIEAANQLTFVKGLDR